MSDRRIEVDGMPWRGPSLALDGILHALSGGRWLHRQRKRADWETNE